MNPFHPKKENTLAAIAAERVDHRLVKDRPVGCVWPRCWTAQRTGHTDTTQGETCARHTLNIAQPRTRRIPKWPASGLADRLALRGDGSLPRDPVHDMRLLGFCCLCYTAEERDVQPSDNPGFLKKPGLFQDWFVRNMAVYNQQIVKVFQRWAKFLDAGRACYG